jgi:hypothetical protein
MTGYAMRMKLLLSAILLTLTAFAIVDKHVRRVAQTAAAK